MENTFADYRERMLTALRAAGLCVYEVNVKDQRYTFFENAEAIYSKSGEQILKEVESFADLPAEEYRAAVSEYFSHPDDEEVIRKAFRAIIERGEPYEYDARMKAGDSQYKWCHLHVIPMKENGEITRMVGVVSDIQFAREHLMALEESVYLDTFTRLYNKQRFIELCNLIMGEDRERKIAMAVFDLDHFKEVNDNFGHMVGDEVLLSVAKQLKEIAHKNDVVARFGGDEFVILMMDADGETAVGRVEQILAQKDNEYGVTMSAGIAIRTAEDEDWRSLFEKADMALYGAKKRRNTYVLYGGG